MKTLSKDVLPVLEDELDTPAAPTAPSGRKAITDLDIVRLEAKIEGYVKQLDAAKKAAADHKAQSASRYLEGQDIVGLAKTQRELDGQVEILTNALQLARSNLEELKVELPKYKKELSEARFKVSELEKQQLAFFVDYLKSVFNAWDLARKAIANKQAAIALTQEFPSEIPMGLTQFGEDHLDRVELLLCYYEDTLPQVFKASKVPDRYGRRKLLIGS